jgi:hypothetical protein
LLAEPCAHGQSITLYTDDPLAFTKLTRLLRQHGLAHIEPTTLQMHRLLVAILRTQLAHQQRAGQTGGGNQLAAG